MHYCILAKSITVGPYSLIPETSWQSSSSVKATAVNKLIVQSILCCSILISVLSLCAGRSPTPTAHPTSLRVLELSQSVLCCPCSRCSVRYLSNDVWMFRSFNCSCALFFWHSLEPLSVQLGSFSRAMYPAHFPFSPSQIPLFKARSDSASAIRSSALEVLAVRKQIDHLLQSYPLYELPRKGIWPGHTPVSRKLYGSLGDLRCTTTLIEETGVSIWRTARRKKLVLCVSVNSIRDPWVTACGQSPLLLPKSARNGGDFVKLMVLS